MTIRQFRQTPVYHFKKTLKSSTKITFFIDCPKLTHDHNRGKVYLVLNNDIYVDDEHLCMGYDFNFNQ